MDNTLTRAQVASIKAALVASEAETLTTEVQRDDVQVERQDEALRLAEFEILLGLAATARDAVLTIDSAINDEVEENVPFPVADLLDETLAILTRLRGRIIRDS